jgi:hypothetical protein
LNETLQGDAKGRHFSKRSDLVWLAVLSVVVLLSLWYVLSRPADGQVAEIYYDNQLIDTIVLTDAVPGRFSYPQNPQGQFEIFDDGSIAFVASDCPDRACVRMGRLRRSGDFAACLPNRFVLRLRPADEARDGSDDVDIVQ